MAVLAADVNLPTNEGAFNDIPVAAATKIYEGALVGIDASGYATNLVAASLKFAGVADRQADNSAGANGDIRVRVRRDHHIRRFKGIAGLALTSLDAAVFASDNATLTMTPAGAAFVGKIELIEDVPSGTAQVKLVPNSRLAAAVANVSAAYTQAEIIAIQDALRNAGLQAK